jgi:hypothetical protein
LITDSFSLASAQAPRIQTTGALTIRPYTASKSIGINGGPGDVDLSSLLLDNIAAGSLILGRSDGSGTMTVNARAWAAPLTLLTGDGDIVIAGAQSMGNNAFLARAAGTGDIVIGAAGGISTTAAANALTLAGRNFMNSAGASALSAPNGRWLVYSTDPAADTTGGLTGTAPTLGSRTYDTDPPATIAAGSRFIYSQAVAPPSPPSPPSPPAAAPVPPQPSAAVASLSELPSTIRKTIASPEILLTSDEARLAAPEPDVLRHGVLIADYTSARAASDMLIATGQLQVSAEVRYAFGLCVTGCDEEAEF